LVKVCEYCNKEFDSRRSKARFCGIDCQNSWQRLRTKVEFICEACGETKLINKFELYNNGKKRQYCSRKCYGNAPDISLIRRNCGVCGNEFTPTYKDQVGCSYKCSRRLVSTRAMDRRPTIVCKYCGKEVKVKECHKDSQLFCSKECDTNWRRENPLLGPDNPCYKPTFSTCDYCGTSFHRSESQVNTDTVFCSIECKSLYQSVKRHQNTCIMCGKEFLSAKKVKMYCSIIAYYLRYDLDPTNKYGSTFLKSKKQILLERGLTCQVCNKEMKTEKNLPDLHHIIPFRYFGTANHEIANNISNLILACRSCHKSIEPIADELLILDELFDKGLPENIYESQIFRSIKSRITTTSP